MKPPRAVLASMGIIACACGLVVVPPAAPAYAASRAAAPAAQELSLAGIGVGSQTVHGRVGTVHVVFPAPATAPADAGSFVRIFFSHSAITLPPASIQVGVNGATLTSVNLDAGTTEGGVFEVNVPGRDINRSDPNVLTVQFTLAAPQAAMKTTAGLSATLMGRTLIHYQLAPPSAAGGPTLAVYPYTMIGDSMEPRPRIGLVLPSSPDDAEIATALRLVADMGRLASPRDVTPDVVTSGQQGWLAHASEPALVIGRLDRLPGVDARLEAAGLTRSGGHWRAPKSATPIPDTSGILVAGADNGYPSVLVTGATDAAVATAASALLTRPTTLDGAVKVIAGTSPVRAPSRTLSFGAQLGDHVSLQGSGDHVLAFGVAAPAADPSGAALLSFQITSSTAGMGTPTVATLVNGKRMSSQQLNPVTNLTVSVPASALKPGQDGIALDFGFGDIGLSDPTSQYTTVDVEAAASTMSLPPPPATVTGLAGLPYPFLDGADANPADHIVVLTARDATTLRAAATTMAALGRGAIGPPAPLTVRSLSALAGRSSAGKALVVIGAPPPQTDALPYLHLQLGTPGSVVVGPPGDTLNGRAVGWVRTVGVADQSIDVLWVGGRDAAGTAHAAGALYDPGLRGDGAVVDATGSGHIWQLPGATVTPSRLVQLAAWLPVVPLGALVVMLVVIYRRRRESRWP